MATEIEYQNMGEDAFTQYDSKKIQYVIYTLFSSTKPRHVRCIQTRLDDELLLVLKSLPGYFNSAIFFLLPCLMIREG